MDGEAVPPRPGEVGATVKRVGPVGHDGSGRAGGWHLVLVPAGATVVGHPVGTLLVAWLVARGEGPNPMRGSPYQFGSAGASDACSFGSSA